MVPGASPASRSSPTFWSTTSRLAATSSTFICRPSSSGSRIWKSSCTFSMSKGTYCSASQRMTSRASASFIRSIWIFLTMTSRPPTEATSFLGLMPDESMRERIVSTTICGSMTSPSTMASAMSGVCDTCTSSGSAPEWSMTATFMKPLPMSSPTVLLLRRRNETMGLGKRVPGVCNAKPLAVRKG